MKTKILLLFIILPFFSQATVWRVNGNPGINADFTDLPEAVSAANSGDTIYLEPLNNFQSYTQVTLSKQLVLIGSGYLLTENDSTQYRDEDARVERLRFEPGSSGSVAKGLIFTSFFPSFTISAPVSGIIFSSGGCILINEPNIHIDGCIANAGEFSSSGQGINLTWRADNCIISNSFLGNTRVVVDNDVESENFGFSGTIITNCILDRPILGTNTAGTSYAGIQSLFVDRSIINWGTCNKTVNTFFSNNIFINSTPCNPCADNSCTFFNNVDVGTSVPNSGDGNILNAGSTIFDPAFATHPELRYALAEGSPAAGNSTTGDDCGIFGGSDPYTLSGMPNIPSIFELDVVPQGNPDSQTLDVNLKAKSHE